MSELPEPPSPGKEWRKNDGKPPRLRKAKRVRVLLRHGAEPPYDNRWNPMSPPGWAIDTTRWSLNEPPFAPEYDVIWYLPL